MVRSRHPESLAGRCKGRRRRHLLLGLTLAEALLSLFLIFMILGVAGVLVQEYSSVSAFASGKDRLLAVAQMALDQIQSEAATATSLQSPTGSTASELRFLRVNPASTTRLPLQSPSPYPSGGSWDPYAAADMVLVRYYLDAASQTLVRTSQVASGGSQTQVMAEGVTGFSVSSQPGGTILITVSVQESKRVTTLSTLAVTWKGY